MTEGCLTRRINIYIKEKIRNPVKMPAEFFPDAASIFTPSVTRRIITRKKAAHKMSGINI